VGFLGEAEGFTGIGLNKKPDVVVNMGGFGAASGDGVGIDVENAAIKQGFESGEARFLADLAERVGQDIGVTVAMAAGLEPEAEFGVVGEEGACPGGVHDPGGGGDVTGLERAGEAVAVGADEGEKAVEHVCFVPVPGHVGLQSVDKIFTGWHGIGPPN
jgi:hypothetical protein